MREHICIRRPEFVAGTTDQPEVGVFTQTARGKKPTPWGRIADGETVWMKWTSGPVVAKAVVEGFRQFEDCTAKELRRAVAGTRLHDHEAYWRSLKEKEPFVALAIYLRDEQWLPKALLVKGRSHASSWLVFPTKADRQAFMEAPPPEPKPRDPRGPRTAGARLRYEVLRRYGHKCNYCGREAPTVKLAIDHIKPYSKGGRTELSNLVVACVDCNSGRGARHDSLR